MFYFLCLDFNFVWICGLWFCLVDVKWDCEEMFDLEKDEVNVDFGFVIFLLVGLVRFYFVVFCYMKLWVLGIELE